MTARFSAPRRFRILLRYSCSDPEGYKPKALKTANLQRPFVDRLADAVIRRSQRTPRDHLVASEDSTPTNFPLRNPEGNLGVLCEGFKTPRTCQLEPLTTLTPKGRRRSRIKIKAQETHQHVTPSRKEPTKAVSNRSKTALRAPLREHHAR